MVWITSPVRSAPGAIVGTSRLTVVVSRLRLIVTSRRSNAKSAAVSARTVRPANRDQRLTSAGQVCAATRFGATTSTLLMSTSASSLTITDSIVAVLPEPMSAQSAHQ